MLDVAPSRAPTIRGMDIARAVASTRSYMSTWMLRSAMRVADDAATIEAEHRGEWGEHALPLMETVASAVISAATFLEAMVNELYTDAEEEHGLTRDGYLAPLDPNTVRLMADYWNVTDGRASVLDKYRMLLSFAGCEPLDRGAEPYQSAALLIGLRNRIVHYRPQTMTHDTVVQGERQLSTMFEQNQLHPNAGTWWPNRALGGGCARWSHESATAFADEVASRLGIVPNYQRGVFGKSAPPFDESA